MPFQISPSHPLRRFFEELVQRRLVQGARIDDRDLARYVANLLVDFTHADNLYRVRNARGKRLEDVGEMLIESNPLLEGRSFIYEREVRKHIGDYTMFLTGLFPEYVARLPRKQFRTDAWVDYVKAGKESYQVVASFDQFEFREAAPLFRRLADRFELCVFGLNMIKADIVEQQRALYDDLQRALE